MISLRIHVKRYRRIFVVANKGNEHSFFCQPIEYRRNTFISNSYVLESVRSRSGFLLRLHHDRVFRRFGLWTTFVNAVGTNKSHIQINEITIFWKSEKGSLNIPRHWTVSAYSPEHAAITNGFEIDPTTMDVVNLFEENLSDF